MPKQIGLLLILGIFGSAIFATGLMVWIFFRASSEPAKTTPKTGIVRQLESTSPEYIFVDGRVAAPAPVVNSANSINFAGQAAQPAVVNTINWEFSASSL